MKILIGGGPFTGKTTLAKKLAEQYKIPIVCTDTVIHKFSWSEASLEVATWIDDPKDFIIEGTIVVRALRKWLKQSTGIHHKPADIVYWGSEPFEPLNSGQITMLMGSETIWKEIKNEVRARGVDVRQIERE